MNTYTDQEILMIQDITDSITGEGDNYDLPVLLKQRLELYPDNRSGAIECSLVEYFSLTLMGDRQLTYEAIRELGLDRLVYSAPLVELPKYINDEGPQVIRQIIATWRLKLGK